MSKIKRQQGIALERGQFIRTCSDPRQLTNLSENRELVASMYRRYRFEWVMEIEFNRATGKHEPSNPTREWVIVGRRGSAFEQGVRKLGLTVSTGMMLSRASQLEWLHPYQIGNGEANFWCDWTEENISRVESFLSLRKRRAKVPVNPETVKRGLEALKRLQDARKA